MPRMPINEWFAQRTDEQRREQSRQAGIASGQARRDKKTFYEITHEMLQDIDTTGRSKGERLMETHIAKAIAGDVKSAVFVAKVDRSLGCQIEVRNLDGQPFEAIKVSKLTNDELVQLLNREHSSKQDDS